MAKFGIGQSVRRVEGPTAADGSRTLYRRYQARRPGGPRLRAALAARPCRRPEHRHRGGRKAPGVLLVLTGEDVTKAGLRRRSLPGAAREPRRHAARRDLAADAGQGPRAPCRRSGGAGGWPRPSRQAKDAAELIEVDYAARPHTVGTYESAQPGAPLVHDHIKDNIVFDWEMGERAKTEAAFAKADKVVRLQIVNNRLVVNSMEPRGAICAYDPKDDRSTLWVSSQGVSMIRPVVADMILKIGSPKLRVRTGDVGGGFGIEDLRASGISDGRVGLAPAQAHGEMDSRSPGSVPVRRAGPRPCLDRRDGARQGQPLHTAAASRPMPPSAPISAISAPSSPRSPARRCWPASTGRRRST